ncbi:MAG TPA: ribosomal protein S19 family protein, partial [Candidatus Woesebacteria bacterium]|nr:ribosomal protein S19 family protein [Candidatus Woesebacteria bacterium]
MSRSSKKGPFIDKKLFDKIAKNQSGVVRTYCRSSQIAPEFVGHH